MQVISPTRSGLWWRRTCRQASRLAGPIDPPALKNVFGDDEETFNEILKDFVDPAKSIAEKIKDAYAGRSAPAVGAAAHKFKSAARTIGAHSLADLCAALEAAGKAQDWEEIDVLAPRIDGELQRVLDYIAGL